MPFLLHTVIILQYFRNGQSSLRLISFNCTLDKYKNERERGRVRDGGWEGGREGGREGEREGGREGVRKGSPSLDFPSLTHLK